MAKFKYVAKDKAGKDMRGTAEAATQEEVLGNLRREGLLVITLRDDLGGKEINLFGGGGTKDPRPHVTSKDLVVFTRQLSTMMAAGISLLECLEVLAEQADDKGFKIALGRIVGDVRAGSDLSEALAKYPKVFANIYINMIKAGEASGQLDVILNRLAEYQEAAEKLKSEIKSAMTYPVISLTLVIGIALFLLIGIIPKFKAIFDSMGVELPLITKIVLWTSNFVKTKSYIWFPGMIALVIAFVLWKKTRAGARQWDLIKLRLPIFGELMRKVAISRFSRTFSTLIKSGVDILTALDIVGKTSGNILMEEALKVCAETVRQGEALSTPLSKFKVFPPMVVRMVGIGEKSGSLEALLEKIAEFYDQEVSATVEAMTSLIEPLMIAVMGVMVGGIVISIMLPIFKLQAALAKRK
ncbi:MAG: type II secretion system F family protein [Planctomycetota bacterium]